MESLLINANSTAMSVRWLGRFWPTRIIRRLWSGAAKAAEDAWRPLGAEMAECGTTVRQNLDDAARGRVHGPRSIAWWTAGWASAPVADGPARPGGLCPIGRSCSSQFRLSTRAVRSRIRSKPQRSQNSSAPHAIARSNAHAAASCSSGSSDCCAESSGGSSANRSAEGSSARSGAGSSVPVASRSSPIV